MTERAGTQSLQFGTYALWAAGLLAALAVRPVPSCAVSLPRCVKYQAPSDVRPAQTQLRPGSSRLRWVMMLRPDRQYKAGRPADRSPVRHNVAERMCPRVVAR